MATKNFGWSKNVLIHQICFMDLSDNHSERQLETALIYNVRSFLLEMSSQFTFIGNQYKIKIEDKEFFIDLLLYHRELQCLVAIEFKIGEFQPEYKGKMEFYSKTAQRLQKFIAR
jgi:predicted nuclease of restriction endonuclease-like (RecB) superfamily